MSNGIGRRTALALPLIGGAACLVQDGRAQSVSRPAVTGRTAERTLRFVPYTNLVVMDPVWSISIVGLVHAYMTCDQLYGLDEHFVPRPQMAAGHEVSSDQLRWRFHCGMGSCSMTARKYGPRTALPRSLVGPNGTRSGYAWPR
jgi:hypothetical protein